MGTAVLLPQDCLSTSKNRHKSDLSEAIFRSDKASRVRRGTLQASTVRDLSTVSPDNFRKNTSTSRVEWTVKSSSLPFRSHSPDSLQANGLPEEVERRKIKSRKPAGVRETKSDTKSAADGPIFTILQRPKSKEAADELIVKFLVKVEEENVLEGQCDQKSDGGEAQKAKTDESRHLHTAKPKLQSTFHSKLSEMKVPGSRLKKVVCSMKVEEPKVVDSNLPAPKLAEKKFESCTLGKGLNADKAQGQNVAVCLAEPINASGRESHFGFDGVMNLKGLSQLASLKAKPENHYLKKAGSASSETLRSKQNYPVMLESIAPSGLSRLNRATTDPQSVKQLAGHYRSETVNIPFSEAKSCPGFTKSTSMSCPERWAGPSYFSSPAPSSLPLPKFSISNQKMLSFQSSVEVHTRNTPQVQDTDCPSPVPYIARVPDTESLSPVPSPPQGGYLDVAFATQSLRRMLKLDPF